MICRTVSCPQMTKRSPNRSKLEHSAEKEFGSNQQGFSRQESRIETGLRQMLHRQSRNTFQPVEGFYEELVQVLCVSSRGASSTRVAWKSYHRVRRQHEVALITVSLTRTARTWRNCSLEVYNPGVQSHVRTSLRLPSILRTWMDLFGPLA